MTSNDLTWEDAIMQVLRSAGEPLHYQEITRRIGQQGLRELTSSTPANTVNAHISRIIGQGSSEIRRLGNGIIEFTDSNASVEEFDQSEDAIDEINIDESSVNLVPAFGLYWERDKVQWDSNQILGRQTPNSKPVNFAGQKGIYLLLKGRYVVYVGRTTDNLYSRLKSHVRGARGPRWDGFSWFGLLDVDEDGNLQELNSELPTEDVITVLESVLIEALEPPINGQRGDRMGVLYEQVIAPGIQIRQNHDILATLGTSLQELVSRG